MDAYQYQIKAIKTAIYPHKHRIIYPAMGLANEAGEVLGKIKKVLRDEDGVFTEENRGAIGEEIGDVAWYLAVLADDLGLNFSNILQRNLEKLASRAERGVIGGSGDNR